MSQLLCAIEIDARNEIRVEVAELLTGSGIDLRRWYRRDGIWTPTRSGIWVPGKHATMLASAVSKARRMLRGTTRDDQIWEEDSWDEPTDSDATGR